ncbi:MAG: 3-methyl-2-oxobutanoate hydroxymethyltransferase [Elusimicrobia bacterium]|jgi:3-methyl-2-oxobutanoate hydroxymethyltransferase|nr:3-methyl-2-oxobutanoate hydroxymethyltransferase [Elusimicrobiota bacterium]
MNKITTTKLKEMKKSGRKITALTCYNFSIARIMKTADIDVVLVGDSLGMVELGYENTIPVTIDEMVHHTRAVKRARPEGLLVTDMPFLSYNVTKQKTLQAAGRLIKEAGAEAVKLEGGKPVADTIKLLVENNIPVMGHLGLTPQAVHKMGGYKVQGKEKSVAAKIVTDAKILEGAGVFAIVLEGIPSVLAREITKKVEVPTIGIGAGPDCDGQILVVNDMLGMNMGFQPKFVKRYAGLEEVILKAFKDYSKDIREGDFPSKIESY